ncbi:hypothetical protein CKM354_001299200 [Cercospora kikuchii]|uniref:Ecp2 effector protein-like domain-containing protein n=1 Tax=Cercospora kikuchii TaxID=84275 RepID=A0A9P3L3B3_9PEZI|nr:uncharacterized protein CKM354_001299200 [Cercospora kikuchii]GIZ49977.1 hypothetical protein CKM354_001299200 [Cercospora kikuchii]
MHFSALTAFVALAAASPLAFPQNAGSGGNTRSNSCDVTSEPKAVRGSGAVPVLDDCNKMRDQIQNGGNAWTITGPAELGKFGTCRFVVTTVTGGEKAFVGVDDVKDLIGTAVHSWTQALQDGSAGPTSYQGTITQQVGVEANVPCDSAAASGARQVEIKWSIEHSK